MRMRNLQSEINQYSFVAEDDTANMSSTSKARHSIHSFNICYAYILFVVLLLLFGLVYILDRRLPDIVESEKDAESGTFIGRNSYNHLVQLTSIGPRVTGSDENEIQATKFLIDQISEIVKITSDVNSIEWERQIDSGSYHLDFKPYGIVNVYNNVQNIVVKLSPKDQESDSSLLINSHFDSVPTSPGASDDGINVSTMLEILRVLATSNEPLKHNVIFLFNGAEENPLEGSHAFITAQQWAKSVKAFINLEACGAGGREILFQAGPGNSWLMKHYASAVPRPHSTVVGEELFQSNIIPSDTDFRVFRDFGHVPGLDFAFAKNGYVYHSKFDHMRSIPNGSYQHLGENILALVKSIANSDELAQPTDLDTSDKIVFFDLLGFYLVSYSLTISYIFNAAIIALTVWIGCKLFKDIKSGSNYGTLITRLIFSIGFQLLGWIVSLALCCLIGLLLDLVRPMSWYAQPLLLITHFVLPTVVATSAILIIFNNLKRATNLAVNLQVQIDILGTIILFNILMILTMVAQMRSAFIFALAALLPICAILINIYAKFIYSVHTWLVIYLISSIFPFMYGCYMALEMLDLFIPITGRIGPSVPVDVMLGAVTAINTIYAMSLFIPLVSLVRNSKLLLVTLSGVSVVMLLLTFLTPIGFPYKVDLKAVSIAPERYWLYHTQRVVHDENGRIIMDDSGVLLLNMDRNSPNIIKNYVPEIISKGVSTEKYCDTLLCCGFPISSSRMHSLSKVGTWVPMETPVFKRHTHLTFLQSHLLPGNIKRLDFTATGSDHLNLFISPKPGVELVSWSFLDFVPKNTGPIWNGRPTYTIMNGYGEHIEAWNFYLDFQLPENANSSQKIVDIVLVGQYPHEDKQRIPEYVKFVQKFPAWAAVTTWISKYEAWVF